ncbi:MAG: glutaredoxin 3 [Eubacteriaceae bacterium]
MAKVKIYTWNHCPYCINAKRLLENKEIKYYEYSIENDNIKYKELCSKTNQNTVPFIFINNIFIGGYNELRRLETLGKLDKMLNI